MTRDGIRAVALAAIMVVSMVAVGAGFAGSAVAQDGSLEEGEIILTDSNGEKVDDFETIQAAVDAASNENNTVVIGPGTYDESVDINADGLTIEGPNAGLAGDNTNRVDEANVSLGNSISADDVTIDGIRIIPNSADGLNTEINGANTTIKNSVIDIPSSGAPFRLEAGSDNTVISQNLFAGDSDATDGGNFVINARQTFSQTIDGVEITDNTFEDALGTGTTAIQAAGFTNADISGNTFDNIGEDAIRLAADVDGTEIQNNEFNNTAQNPNFPAAAIVANDVAAGSNVDISNNQFGAGDDRFLVAYNRAEEPALNLSNILSQDNTFEPGAVVFAGNSLVSETAVNVINTDQQTGFNDIQTAINNATASDTIQVSEGDYNESIEINVDGLTIVGPNAGTSGHDNNRMSEATVKGQVVVSADGVVLDGVEVSPPNATTNTNSEALRVSGAADNVIIRNNIVRDFGEDGIPEWEGVEGINVFGGQESDAVHNITIADNIVESVSGRSTKGGAAGISVQGNVGSVDVSDNVVRNIGQRETAWAFGIVVRGTENNDQPPSQVSVIGNNISGVRSNSATETVGVGLGIEGPDATAITLEENTLSEARFLLEDKTTTVNLTAFTDSNTLNRGALVEKAVIDGDTRNVVFNRTQDALSSVPENETISLLSGTYDSSVSIDTAGVTIEGPNADQDGSSADRTGEAIISGQVDIGAPNVTVAGVQVSPDTDTFEEKPAAAVYVAASDASVENTRVGDFAVNITEIGVSSVQGIQIYSASTELAGVSIQNNSIQNVSYDGSQQAPGGSFGPDYGNLYGIHVQGEISDAVVSGNSLRDLESDGYVLGAAVSGTGSNPAASPEDITVERNMFEDLTAEGAPATAFVVSSDSVDINSLTVSRNTFETPVAVASGASETVDATLNYFGNTTPTVQGDVTYDPFLTVKPDEVDAESLDETTQFGHDLVIPADGDTHSVAFPAAAEGTVDEVFGDFNGTVYAYNGTNWVGNEDIADQRISALDAFAVTIDEGESDQRITFEYADGDSEIPEMTSTELEAGWNFVGAPSNGTASNAFGVSTTEVASVVNVVGGPADKSTPYRLAGSDEINPTTVGPFQGYWVFATDDGELGAAVPVGPTQSDEETTLKGN